MEQRPYLGGEDQDSLLPPSSPPIIGPSSPLTVLDESEDHPPTMRASSESPLSSPPESPTPDALAHTLVPPLVLLAQRLALNNRHSEAGGSEDSFIPSSPIRSREDMMRKAQKRRDESEAHVPSRRGKKNRKRRTTAFKQCLDILSTNELTFAELTEYVFFHDDQTPEWRHENSLSTDLLLNACLTSSRRVK
ncbi:hypothetical protein EDB84DRAFT_1447456 [Lactarius hengduanensis]|nr:hypothetical protein EDB84DRAFT_1447456 [Lactarius hengduanensis]